MHDIDLILTLTASLAVALVLGYLTRRMGLSPIVGYLLAGVAVGPHTPGFVADRAMAEQFAEIGVILLMFGVGLQFRLDELFAVRRIAIPGAVFQSLVATLLGVGVTTAFGWSWQAGIVYGLAISVASTVVLTRVLSDQNDLHTPTGHIAIGWLVVEDIFTVLALVLLPALVGGPGGRAGNIPVALGLAVLQIGVLVASIFLVGGRLIPWLLSRVAATRSRELFTLTVLVVALGIAVGAAKLFGASMALGAFLAGLVVGRSEFSLRAASEALPMRDAFAVLFFVSAGMMFNPAHLLEAPGMVAATLAIILLGKPLAALGIVLFMRYPLKTALAVAMALAQIGEFSFILAELGKDLRVLTDSANNTLVVSAIVSISLNPLLYRLVDPLEAWASRHPRLWRLLNARVETGISAPLVPARDVSRPGSRHRAIVVGYGAVGKTVARLLRENEIEPAIIELNLETFRHLAAEGVQAIYGDASHRQTLKSAGVEGAVSLILSASGIRGSAEVIRLARELNPSIRIIARSTYLQEVPSLRQAGAEVVFAAEGEIALAMTESILRQLGATPEQIDRERERLHADLLGESRPPARPDPVKAGGEDQATNPSS